jgi:hypothetical protein
VNGARLTYYLVASIESDKFGSFCARDKSMSYGEGSEMEEGKEEGKRLCWWDRSS